MAKILVVDDTKSMRDLIKLTLEDDKHEVVLAEDGLKALEIANQNLFDLVLTDINMPNMDGFELISNLRGNPNFIATPILCLTTEASKETKLKGRTAGATGWIVKPFNPQSLIKTLKMVL